MVGSVHSVTAAHREGELEHQHCGLESERPIFTPGMEQSIRGLASSLEEFLDRGGDDLWAKLENTSNRLNKLVTEIDSLPDDLHHEWHCEFDGDIEPEYLAVSFGKFEKIWNCPWCEQDHSEGSIHPDELRHHL